MRTFSNVPLPEGLLDQWKRWERGRNMPDEFYRPIIAATIGTVVSSIFPEPRVVPPRTTDDVLLIRSGMDTHELVQRIRQSSVTDNTLDALHLTVEQLCCDYASAEPNELISTSREWLTRLSGLLDQRLTLTQHRDVLDAAGWRLARSNSAAGSPATPQLSGGHTRCAHGSHSLTVAIAR